MKFIYVYVAKDKYSISLSYHIVHHIKKKLLKEEYSIYENMFEFIELNSKRFNEILPNISREDVLIPQWYIQREKEKENGNQSEVVIENIEIKGNPFYIDWYIDTCFEKIDELLQERIPVLK